MIWLKFAGKTIHMLKLAGAFFALTAVFKVAEASYQIFVTVSKINAAEVNPALVSQFFGWTTAATAYPSGPAKFLLEDTVGIMLGPMANFLLWLGLAVLAIMVYQSGHVLFPVEEYEKGIAEHHRGLIERAVAHARKAKK